MLNHPALPAILLAISAWRLVTGTATWLTAVSALAAALWFASAWKNWSHAESSNVLMAACFVCASNGAPHVIPESFMHALEHLADPAVGFPEHQMLGHGQKVQWAPVERAEQTLLLHLFGDRALEWHADSGCALQFWIESEALERADFGSVKMTLECD